MGANRYMFNLYKWAKRKFHKNPKEYEDIIEEIRKLSQNNLVSEEFDISAVEQYLLQSPRLKEIYLLLTLMIYVDEMERRFEKKVHNRESGIKP